MSAGPEDFNSMGSAVEIKSWTASSKHFTIPENNKAKTFKEQNEYQRDLLEPLITIKEHGSLERPTQQNELIVVLTSSSTSDLAGCTGDHILLREGRALRVENV